MVSDAFRAMIRDAERARVPTSAPCRLLGEQVGERECPTCRGHVRVKLYACPHHPDGVTLAECADCPHRPVTVSVIVVACNEPDVTETVRCLWSRAVDEVIVVDDASTDGSCQPVADAKGGDLPPLHVLRTETRIGCNPCRQWGAREATGDVLVFMDAHMRVSGADLRTLAQEAWKRGGVAQAHSRGMELKSAMRGYGARWRPTDRAAFELKWMTTRPDTEWTDTPGLMGACYCVPAHVFRRIGGFMENTGLWGFTEGVLSLKCNLAGVPIVVSRDIFARHLYRKASERHYDLPGNCWWVSRYAGLKIALESGTFEALLPKLQANHSHPAIGELLSRPGLQAEHEHFQRIRTKTDAEWAAEHGLEVALCDSH